MWGEHMSHAETEWIQIGNEFAVAKVRKVFTRNGERLEIVSPRMGYVVRLDALALESLSWQTIDTFSKFLEMPFGPSGELVELESEHEHDADTGRKTRERS